MTILKEPLLPFGVEAGQLLFVGGGVLLPAAGLKRLPVGLPERTKARPPCPVDSLGIFRVIERG